MKRLLTTLVLLAATASYAAPPNILFISIDDLNDWTGGLGGHPQAKTPHMDAVAARGNLFTNAHCQAPVCAPSRFSLMSGRYPSATGLYFLNPETRAPGPNMTLTLLPQRFAKEGYRVQAVGKLFHSRMNQSVFGALDGYGGSNGGFGPIPKKKISQPHGHPLWDWGAYPDSDQRMPDHKTATWAADKLASMPGDKPFFLGVGFYRPHVPMFAPKAWFDRFPLDTIKTPKVNADDLDDLSPYAIALTREKHVAPTHEWMTESGEWPHAVQAYLASIAFADHCLGIVLDALEKSPHRDNTLVVVWSDHGFHLGEKNRWAKRSLWENGTRVPIIIARPGETKAQRIGAPVGLIDLYPTLLDLCGFTPDPELEGRSLRPLLEQPDAPWDRPIRTTFGPGNHSLRDADWRYIRYHDGSEELYDHRNDPNEWTNLAGESVHANRLATFRKRLPQTEHPILGKGSTGHNAFEAARAKR